VISDAVDWVGDAITGFPDWSVDVFNDVVDWLGEISAAAWVLLLIGLVCLWYVWLSIRHAGVLGNVKVTLQADSSIPTSGLSARLTQELMDKDLLPGDVPAGAPSTTVVAAVAAAPVPQATWLSKLLEVATARFPRPPDYEVRGTLTTREAAEPGAPEERKGVTYTLTATSRPRLVDADTVWATEYLDALKKLARVVYMKVSVSNASVFPPWARWWKTSAFDNYVAGLEAEPSSTDSPQAMCTAITQALCKFEAARSAQPDNWMPAMRAANLHETQAALTEEPIQRQEYEVQALETYLDIIKHAPMLAHARYRASVRLSLLSAGPDPDAAVAAALRKSLGLRSDASVPAISRELRSAALRQSRQTRNLLRWWGVPLKAGRLRNRFEPRGRDRRQFLKAVKISRRCIHEQVAWVVPWDRAAVRFAFVLRWNSAGWQAHYNAACFFAIRKDWERAVRHLKRSIGDPQSGVTQFWLLRDPDLEELRDLTDSAFPEHETWDKIAQAA
jgi:hypothetical protein